MGKIEIYTCENGHKFLPTKECPFCCALHHMKPKDTNELFLKIYADIEGKSAREIEEYYQSYIPPEPEQSVADFSKIFR